MSLIRILMKVEGYVAAAAYAVTTLLLLADVISREFLSQSLWGAQQIAVLGSILAGMVGLTLATGQSAHFRPEFADGILKFGAVDRVGDVISAIIFAVLAFFAVEFVLESRDFADRAPVVNLLLWPLQIVVPYAMASSALKHLVFALTPEAKSELRGS